MWRTRSTTRTLRDRLQIEYLKDDVPSLMRESKEGITAGAPHRSGPEGFSRVDSVQAWEFADLHQRIDSTLNIVASELRLCADVVREYGALPQIECLPSRCPWASCNSTVAASTSTASPGAVPPSGSACRSAVRLSHSGGRVAVTA
ncbi:MAG TPA: hypothetical protein VEZ89_16735 [Rubrivivax sp.]|nr:hypothetical protein [Rubrivivax sp.]